jgi:hypothetical protein
MKTLKTSILTALLIFGIALTNFAKPINDIYSLNDPLADNIVHVTGHSINNPDIIVNSCTDSNDLIPDENPKAKGNDNSGENKNVSCTEKVMYEDLATRLNDYYKDEAGNAENKDFDFVICDKDQGSQFYVPVKISPVNNIKSSNQDGLTVPGSSL